MTRVILAPYDLLTLFDLSGQTFMDQNLPLIITLKSLLIIFELREAAKVSLEDYLKLEREKKLNEESLMNQVTQLQNDKDELKTEIFKLKHKVEKVRMLLPAEFQVYY